MAILGHFNFSLSPFNTASTQKRIDKMAVLDEDDNFNPIPLGGEQILPLAGFSILAPKRFGVGILNFLTFFIIDFCVLSQNLS